MYSWRYLFLFVAYFFIKENIFFQLQPKEKKTIQEVRFIFYVYKGFIKIKIQLLLLGVLTALAVSFIIIGIALGITGSTVFLKKKK